MISCANCLHDEKDHSDKGHCEAFVRVITESKGNSPVTIKFYPPRMRRCWCKSFSELADYKCPKFGSWRERRQRRQK